MNVLVSMYFAGISVRELHPVFIAGLILVSVGAVTVFLAAPSEDKKSHAHVPAVEKTVESDAHADSKPTDTFTDST